jgi:hypothetical protein
VSVAVTDRIWFTYACGLGWRGGIGSIDITAAKPTAVLEQGAELYYGPPALYTAARANVLVADDSLPQTDVYAQTADGKLTRTTSKRDVGASGIALTADGSKFYGGGRPITAYSTADLSIVGQFSGDGWPVVLSADDARLAAGGYGDQGATIDIYTTSAGQRQASFALGTGLRITELAWTPDGSRSVAITVPADGGQTTPTLHIVQP